jgi:hypothetical protein
MGALARHLMYGGDGLRRVSSSWLSWRLRGALFEDHSEFGLLRCLSAKTHNSRIWGPCCLALSLRFGLCVCLCLSLQALVCSSPCRGRGLGCYLDRQAVLGFEGKGACDGC